MDLAVLQNPFREQSDGMLPVWIAVEGERVVGQIAVRRLYSRLTK